MGTKMAPPYAALFLGKLEEDKILNGNYSYLIQTFLRFLDDIFMIWNGTLGELTTFFHISKFCTQNNQVYL